MPRLHAIGLLALASVSHAPAQQESWSLNAPAHMPSARYATAMAYDDARGVIVLFGGTPSSGGSHLGDTWEWDGRDWSHVDPLTSPSARSSHAMAYDPIRRCVVLFGGVGASSARRSDTWEYDGADWTRRDTLPTNDGRHRFAMAFDPVRGQVVRFGGAGAGGSFGDTHAWDGTHWTLLAAGGPTPRSLHAMATDTVREQIVLFGGLADSGGGATHQNDTWIWNGQSWQQYFPATVPPTRLQHGMAFDLSTAKVVMFGGQSVAGAEQQTWAFDSSNWSLRTTTTSPPSQIQEPICYHAASDRVVLFTSTAQTWRYFAPTLAPATWDTFGAGCPGGNGVPALAAAGSSLPFAASPFRLELTQLGSGPFVLPFCIVGFSNTTWGSYSLPLGLELVGLPGCTLFVEISVAESMSRSGSRATWSVDLPASAGLVGTEFWVQALVIDPGAPNGAALSNAGHGRIGAR